MFGIESEVHPLPKAAQSQAAQKVRRVFRSSPHQTGNEAPRHSLLANPGSLLVAVFGIGFVAYVFNFQGLATGLDRYFGSLNHAAQEHQKQVASMFVGALPVVGGSLLVLLLLALLRGRGTSRKQAAKTVAREIRGVEGFVSAATEQGISPKVARAAYRVLLPYVRKSKYLNFKDTLCHDLKVREDQISDVYGSLLRLSDRRRKSGDNGANLRSVSALLLAVEASVGKSVPSPALLAMQALALSDVPESALAAPRPALTPKKPSAVLVHPARLPRRELSMIRSRPIREV